MTFRIRMDSVRQVEVRAHAEENGLRLGPQRGLDHPPEMELHLGNVIAAKDVVRSEGEDHMMRLLREQARGLALAINNPAATHRSKQMNPPIPFPKRPAYRPPHGRIERESPSDQLKDIQQEARMVLPGIQALFGFQLIVVFNPGFKTAISGLEQGVHLVAILMSALAILLVIAPVAYHRQAQPGIISERLVRFGSRCLGIALFPLITAIALDIYVVSHAVTGTANLSFVLASVMFVGFLWVWYIFPLSRKMRDLRQSRTP